MSHRNRVVSVLLPCPLTLGEHSHGELRDAGGQHLSRQSVLLPTSGDGKAEFYGQPNEASMVTRTCEVQTLKRVYNQAGRDRGKIKCLSSSNKCFDEEKTE